MKDKFLSVLENKIIEDKLPHSFLIEVNDHTELMRQINSILIKQNILNKDKTINELSTTVVEPENNKIDVSKIIELQRKFQTTNINSNYKIFYIVNSEKMNLSAANKLLKFLEEPENNILGFLFTANLQENIATIKSRCEIFRTLDLAVENQEIEKLAEEMYDLLTNFADLNLKLLELKSFCQKEKSEVAQIIKSVKTIYLKLIIGESENKNVEFIAKKIKILDNVIERLNFNVNLELALSKLCIELEKLKC